MKRFLTLLLFCIVSLMQAVPVTLVSSGKANAVIVLDDKPTAASQMAALEINYFLKKMSGTELKVVKASDKVNAPHKIFITSKIPGKIIGEYWKVACDGKNITLSGKDSPVYNKVDYANVDTFPRYDFHYNGSLFAAYQFMEDALNIRFFGPEDAENCYPVSKTVTANTFTKEFTPKFDAFRLATNYYKSFYHHRD